MDIKTLLHNKSAIVIAVLTIALVTTVSKAYDLQQEVDNLTDELDDTKSTIRGLEATNENLTDQLNSLASQYSSLQSSARYHNAVSTSNYNSLQSSYEADRQRAQSALQEAQFWDEAGNETQRDWALQRAQNAMNGY